MEKNRECTISCPESDPLWEILEEKRKDAGLETIGEAALMALRTACGLPSKYEVRDLADFPGIENIQFINE